MSGVTKMEQNICKLIPKLKQKKLLKVHKESNPKMIYRGTKKCARFRVKLKCIFLDILN